MERSIKEVVKDAIEELITDNAIIIEDDNGNRINDATTVVVFTEIGIHVNKESRSLSTLNKDCVRSNTTDHLSCDPCGVKERAIRKDGLLVSATRPHNDNR